MGDEEDRDEGAEVVPLHAGSTREDRAIARAEREAAARPEDRARIERALSLRAERAIDHLDADRYAEALRDIEHILSFPTVGCHAHVLHAWALSGLDDHAGACRAVERAIEAARPTCEPRLLAMAALVVLDLDPELAQRAIDRGIELHPGVADLWVTRAKLHVPSQEALADYSRALELEPTHAEALALRAKILSDGRHGALEAQRDAQRAARLAPDDDVVLAARAAVMSNVGRHAEAARDLERVAELRGDDPDAHAERAEVLERAGDHRAAVDAWSKAIERDGRRGYFYARRGRALDRIGNRKGALRDLDTAVAKDPSLLTWRADLHEAHGRLARAALDLDRAIALLPDDGDDEDEIDLVLEKVSLIARRGWLRLAMHREGKAGMLAKALHDFERAIEIDSSCAHALAGRGAVREVRGELDAALLDLDDALGLDPSDPAYFSQRARLHEALGNRAAAIADLRDAAEKGDAAARKKLEELGAG